MKTKLHLLTAVLFAGMIAGCTPEPDPGPTSNNSAPSPVIGDGDGTLVAIKNNTTTETPIGPISVTLGLGSAFFYNTGDYTNFIPAGNVTLNGSGLEAQDNNAYVFVPDETDYEGISFSSGVSWNVTGAGNIPSFSHTVANSFPSASEITSGETVTRSAGYTLTVNSVSGADSVLFIVGEVSKTLPGTATSYTFTASELSSLAAGTSVVMVAPYNYEGAVYGGRTFYFVNEMVESKTVTIE